MKNSLAFSIFPKSNNERLILNTPLLKYYISHILILLSLYNIFIFLNFIISANNGNLVQWDVVWYQTIKEDGYSYNPNGQCNLAFFPLFPYFWKLIDSSPLGISLINFIITLISFSILYNAFKIKQRDLLLALSVPSLAFCYVPYSEAFFFLFSSITIWGLQKNNNWIVALGLFLSCVTRSVSMTYIPILVFFTFLQLNHNKRNNLSQIKWLLIYVAVTILALFTTFYIQYLQTGEFFAMFNVQKYWDKKLHSIELVDSWGGLDLMWIDGFATLIGFVAICLCFNFFIRKTFKFKIKRNATIAFSLSYLAVVTLLNLFYGPIDENQSVLISSIHSMNRYVLCTSFFTIFIILIPRLVKPNLLNNTLFISITLITLSWFAATELIKEVSVKIFNYYGLLFLFVLAYYFQEIRNRYWQGLYIFNIILQLYLFNKFLNGHFIG